MTVYADGLGWNSRVYSPEYAWEMFFKSEYERRKSNSPGMSPGYFLGKGFKLEFKRQKFDVPRIFPGIFLKKGFQIRIQANFIPLSVPPTVPKTGKRLLKPSLPWMNRGDQTHSGASIPFHPHIVKPSDCGFQITNSSSTHGSSNYLM